MIEKLYVIYTRVTMKRRNDNGRILNEKIYIGMVSQENKLSLSLVSFASYELTHQPSTVFVTVNYTLLHKDRGRIEKNTTVTESESDYKYLFHLPYFSCHCSSYFGQP